MKQIAPILPLLGFCLVGLPHPASPQIVLSEIMFNAPEMEAYEEFIELYNAYPASLINLEGYRLGDQAEQDSLIETGAGFVLPPGGFALILDPGYWEHSTIYDAIIPPDALILTLSDTDFGAGGLRNDPPDTVILINPPGQIIASFTYTSDNLDGYSEEKIRLAAGDNPVNWTNSLSYLGTPGFSNSVQPPDLDLAVLEFCANPSPLPYGSPLELFARLLNAGLEATPSSVVTFALSDPDMVLPDSLLGTQAFPALPPADSTDVSLSLDPLPPGPHRLFAWHSLTDDRPDNDTLSLLLLGGYPEQSLIINEICARPGGEGCEWVELLNPGSAPVDLMGFAFSDEDTSNRAELTASSAVVDPEDFALLAEDDRIFDLEIPPDVMVIVLNGDWPTLNDAGDTPTLFDAALTVQDAVPYTGWTVPAGISLERVLAENPSNDPQNWQPSLDPSGGTPGRINSVQPPDLDLAITNLAADPSPLPCGSPLQLNARLINRGLQPTVSCEVAFALGDPDGFAPDSVLGYQGFPALSPSDSADVTLSVEPLPPGPHRILAWHNLEDNRPENDSTDIVLLGGYPEKSLIINEIFARPIGENCEWVELFNPGGGNVNLWGFAFSDQDTSGRAELIDTSLTVASGGFALLAADSSIFDIQIPQNLALIVLSGDWPPLNDLGDTPTLFDAAGAIQDAVPYSGWTVPADTSLERLYPDQPSDDPANWQPSTDPSGGTPGRTNSALPTQFDLAVTSLQAEPSPLPSGSPVTLTARLENQGLVIVEGGEAVFALGGLDDASPDTLIGEVNFPTIAPTDSHDAILILESFPPGSHRVFAWHNYQDDNPQNDTLSLLLPGGYPEKSLIINEIYARTGGQGCEWVELHNPYQTDVDLLNFSFSDADTSDKIELTDSSATISPGEFALLAEDSAIFNWELPAGLQILIPGGAWPALNDDGDTPTLFDAAGGFQDAVPYTGWTIPVGVSLERISPSSPSSDPDNWQPSLEPSGGTPGRPNTVQPPAPGPCSASLSFSPDPFDPDRHGTLQVRITIPPDAASAAVIVFDLRGRRLKVLFDDNASGQVNLPPWDGRDMEGRRLTPGLYVMFAEFRDSGGQRKQIIKNTLVIAGKL